MGNETSRNRQGLTEREVAVLRANSNLSEQEIREAYKDFVRECPSGKMNKAQFRNFFVKFSKNQSGHSDVADKMFPVFDQNGDGTVTFNELVLGSAMTNPNDVDSQLELAYDMIDTSGDGNVSYQELVKFIQFVKKLPDRHVNIDPDTGATLIFEQFGLNKHQKISKRQFIEAVKTSHELRGMLGGYA